MKCLILILSLSYIFGCARSPIKDLKEAMRPSKEMPELQDDMDFASLVEGLEAQAKFLKEKTEGPQQFGFGPRVIDRNSYVKALEFLVKEGKADPTGEKFRQSLRANFEAFEVYGTEKWGEIFMTSYFEPVINGAAKPSAEFSQPLYTRPKDLVDVDLGSFIPVRPSLSVLEKTPLEQRSRGNTLRGRLLASENPERSPRVVAYPDRAGIYSGEINKVAQPLAYVHPIDAFVLEIQGSGVVKFKDGKELKVGYAAQNGHPYVPIGKHLFEVIPKEKMSLFAIENHLRSLTEPEARKLMSLNPSYVFFKPLTNRGITFLGNELQPGRTIATDHFYFPKGVLALLQFEKPQFDSETAVEPSSWTPSSRFVFDQDTGGAIRGPGRVDLYSGRGAIAKQTAAVMKNKGRLYYFVPRPEFLATLETPALP